MALEIIVPEVNSKSGGTKDLVFSILSESPEKTLTQLHRELKKRYGVSVSFQAVLKAVNTLCSRGVLKKKKMVYSLSEDWIIESKKFFDRLYSKHLGLKREEKKIEAGKEISVYTVNNLLELDRIWYELLVNWAKKEKSDCRNCWMGKHAWWLLPRLQEEDELHDFLRAKKIKTYNFWTSTTELDKSAAKYYRKRGEHAKIKARPSEKTDRHIAAFGEYTLKFSVPEKISEKLEEIYKKTKKTESLDVKEAIDIFKEKTEIELTIIKDKLISDKVKEEIIGKFKEKQPR